jgi:hypothetical protein
MINNLERPLESISFEKEDFPYRNEIGKDIPLPSVEYLNRNFSEKTLQRKVTSCLDHLLKTTGSLYERNPTNLQANFLLKDKQDLLQNHEYALDFSNIERFEGKITDLLENKLFPFFYKRENDCMEEMIRICKETSQNENFAIYPIFKNLERQSNIDLPFFGKEKKEIHEQSVLAKAAKFCQLLHDEKENHKIAEKIEILIQRRIFHIQKMLKPFIKRDDHRANEDHFTKLQNIFLHSLRKFLNVIDRQVKTHYQKTDLRSKIIQNNCFHYPDLEMCTQLILQHETAKWKRIPYFTRELDLIIKICQTHITNGNWLSALLSPFDLGKTPSLNFSLFIRRYSTYDNHFEPSSFFSALFFMQKVTNGKAFTLPPSQFLTLFASSQKISGKFLNDFFYSNAFQAHIAGLSLFVFNRNEQDFLDLSNWEHFITKKEYDSFRLYLQDFVVTYEKEHPLLESSLRNRPLNF